MTVFGILLGAALLVLLIANILIYRKRLNLDKQERPRYGRGFRRFRSPVRSKLKKRSGKLPPLPDPSKPLAPYLEQRVSGPFAPVHKVKTRHQYEAKANQLRTEFDGQPELHFLNAFAIANMRRKDSDDALVALFFRIWQDQREEMLQSLNSRWLLSSVSTFERHGQTESQRKIGAAACIFFNLIRMYESERLASGLDPEEFVPSGDAKRKITMGFGRFYFPKGDADSDLFGDMARLIDTDPLAGPMLKELLDRLNCSQDQFFARVYRFRKKQENKATTSV